MNIRGPLPLVRSALTAVAGLSLYTVAHAQIYFAPSTSGAVVLSDVRSDVTPDLLLAEPQKRAHSTDDTPHPSSATSNRAAPSAELVSPRAPPLPASLVDLILSAARLHGVAAPLLAAVAAAESGFNANARSPKGAGGLMQLMPDTARRFKVDNRFSARQSLEGGAAYLRWLEGRFSRDRLRVLAAYNAGEQAVLRADGMPPFAETQAYVPRVLAYMRQYEALSQLGSVDALAAPHRGSFLPQD
jgi:Transglycosylase SLT domain